MHSDQAIIIMQRLQAINTTLERIACALEVLLGAEPTGSRTTIAAVWDESRLNPPRAIGGES